MTNIDVVNDRLREEAAKAPYEDFIGILPCQGPLDVHNGTETSCYPKCDLSIWLRSCIRETTEPLPGRISGRIPHWLDGSLLQNGPGKFFFGSQVMKHLFDGSGLLQKFHIAEGTVTYECRFVRSRHFVDNLAAQKVVTNEFATVTCSGRRPLFKMPSLEDIMSDNTFITVKPLGKEYFCYYESPFVQQVDPDTLATVRSIDLNASLGLVMNASHPHYDEQGNMISLGLKLGLRGPFYVIQSTEARSDGNKKHAFEESRTVATLKCRWPLDPGYMHSFAVTENYFVLIEQPMTVNVVKLLKSCVGRPKRRKALIEAMRWNGKHSTLFHVIERSSGERLKLDLRSDAFFFMHTINAFEDEGHIVVDIACYEKPDMIYCMYLEALQTAQSTPDYADKFRGRPKRFVLPLKRQRPHKHEEDLVGLDYTEAKAIATRRGTIFLKPEQICDVGCETPTIFYERYNGKKYRYFYAITSDTDDPNVGQIFKVDTLTHRVWSWHEPNSYCAEPIFVPRPTDCDREDDGIILASMIRGKPQVRSTCLLVLDAVTMTELGRAEFECGGPVPKPLHGYFTGNNPFTSDKRCQDL